MLLKASASSSILQNPAEHFTSLNSPSATVRARQPAGDGTHTGDQQHVSPANSTGVSLDVGSQPGSRGAGRTRSGGLGGGMSSPPVPAAAMLRRALWMSLQGLLVATTLAYLREMRKAGRDLYFLYYQPFLPMLSMLWLWAVAVRVFEQRRIRYEVCFSAEDQRFLLRSGQLFQVCNVLTAVILASGCSFLYLLTWGLRELAALQPPLLYTSLLVLLLFPGSLLFRASRLFFAGTLWRVFTPLRPVSWADFLLADVLTSLAKALSDTERAVCSMMTGPVLEPNQQACSDGSFIIPLGLCAPYAWRLVQCLRVYLDTGARPQLFNALKYSTAFPVILLSAVKSHVAPDMWRHTFKPLWLAAAFLNSAYSFFWDVERDWEISWFSQMGARRDVPAPVLRGHLLYRRPFYLYLMVSNLVLRLSWTYKLSPHLRDHHVVVFFIVLAEAFRRFQWLFVRIEVELRKIQGFRPDLGVLVPSVGYAAHAHSSEAPDSDVEQEDDSLQQGKGGASATRLVPIVPGHAVSAQHRGGLGKHGLLDADLTSL
ncbi:hypothetical protein D9Q98_002245 [Chlorella vulgaris]|uniref:EXS domain-containing protein n=1 Tax=Chlorella vulgaris TaxID=3077 RepID=A0A9D4TWH3_CHLVU|nr:hypothetical protein D9Q98_002245 [Chlorella vulgaris]